MEPHEYQEREAELDRREQLDERKRRFVPPSRETPRTAEEILAEARKECTAPAAGGCDVTQIAYEMCGNLANQIHHLEVELRSLVLDQLDRLE